MRRVYCHAKDICKLMAALLPVLALAGCEKETSEEPQATLRVIVEMAGASQTRTASTGLQSIELDRSITAGIYAYLEGQTSRSDDSDYGLENITYSYVTDKDKWKCQAINFPLIETNKLDIYVYAPRQSAIGSLTNIPVTVATDQSTDAAYLASDFVFGNQKSIANPGNNEEQPVTVTLYHAMTKVILNIQDKDGGTDNLEQLSKVELGSARFPVMTDAYVNITRSITSNGDLTSQSAVLTGGTPGIITLMDVSKVSRSFTMAGIIPPQSLGDGDNLTLYFESNGQTSAFEGNLSGTLLPGYVYTYTVVVDQSELTIMNASIVPWGTTESVSKVLSNPNKND